MSVEDLNDPRVAAMPGRCGRSSRSSAHLHSVSDSAASVPSLTDREFEVTVAWLRSDSKEDAGRELFIAPTTVAVHISRVRGKYRECGRPASTKVALAVRLLQDGLIAIEDLL